MNNINTRFENQEKVKVENMRGGMGVIYLQKIKDVAMPCKMYAKITIPSKSSIGLHSHTEDQEIIYCLEGEATIISDGVTSSFKKGDINVNFKNHEHSIINNGCDDVVLLAIVTEA